MENPFGITERKARAGDEDFFCSLVEETLKDIISAHTEFKPEVVRERFHTSPDLMIMMKGKRRIGMYQLGFTDDSLGVHRFFLSPAYQRRGIGTWYMQHFEDMARSQGLDRMSLEVWDNNPARFLYKKLGYKRVGVSRPHKWKMEKKL
ncbi:GNAT family N-acetyltransferase [Candidatus Woesearchaeota archaeon]|nr:GNAT family N-acetyltransferase [Candidatus Woesearchaeota archaeon]